MRDAVRRALVQALNLVLPSRGRHRSAADRGPVPTPGPRPVGLWGQPWPTPTPAHVVERHTPLRGEDVRLVRPYVSPARHPPHRTVARRPRKPVYAVFGRQVEILGGLYARHGRRSVRVPQGAAG
ncbi:hypothetical protein ACFYT4_04005 [Streptomyces sp. NPDC004609]|uniref:hypothetical protein n=1 Tax=Streptomyces sp. NPDC004609 TaxID=3364704 RepID=UPI0036BA2A2A